MYLQRIYDKRRNKTYLSVARGYRDENGKTKHKTLQYFGAVEDLKSLYDAPIAHLLDGYYMIVSSEMEKTDDEIIVIYRGLWRIEETFKVTKSELEDRPIYV